MVFSCIVLRVIWLVVVIGGEESIVSCCMWLG